MAGEYCSNACGRCGRCDAPYDADPCPWCGRYDCDGRCPEYYDDLADQQADLDTDTLREDGY